MKEENIKKNYHEYHQKREHSDYERAGCYFKKKERKKLSENQTELLEI